MEFRGAPKLEILDIVSGRFFIPQANNLILKIDLTAIFDHVIKEES